VKHAPSAAQRNLTSRTGSIVMALALWVLLTDEDCAGWWNDRTVH
jgi:hypothetical protein